MKRISLIILSFIALNTFSQEIQVKVISTFNAYSISVSEKAINIGECLIKEKISAPDTKGNIRTITIISLDYDYLKKSKFNPYTTKFSRQEHFRPTYMEIEKSNLTDEEVSNYLMELCLLRAKLLKKDSKKKRKIKEANSQVY